VSNLVQLMLQYGAFVFHTIVRWYKLDCMSGDMPDVIICAKFYVKKIKGFRIYGGSNFGFSQGNGWSPLQQCCASAQPVVRRKMSSLYIILSSWPSLCWKLSKFLEIWQSYDKNNFDCFLRHVRILVGRRCTGSRVSRADERPEVSTSSVEDCHRGRDAGPRQ